MAINGLESIHKNTKIRKFGGLSREAYFLEFKAHCNINLPVNRCSHGDVICHVTRTLGIFRGFCKTI